MVQICYEYVNSMPYLKILAIHSWKKCVEELDPSVLGTDADET